MLRTSFRCTFALAAFACSVVNSEEFFLKDNDSVVFIGDSITEQHLYTNFVETWVNTRFPDWKLTFAIPALTETDRLAATLVSLETLHCSSPLFWLLPSA